MTFYLKLFLLVSILASCASSPQKKFDQALTQDKCEEAVEYLPSSKQSLLDATQVTAGSIASYTLSGLAYGADATLYVVGGLVVPATICSPVILVEAYAGSTGQASIECFGRVLGSSIVKDLSPKEMLGKQVYKGTESWRCADFSDFSSSLREVVSCYEKREELESLEKGLTQLTPLLDVNFQNNCVSENERALILNQHNELLKKIEVAKKSSNSL